MKRMAILDGSNNIKNVAVWDGITPWNPGSSIADITGRIHLGRGHQYVPRSSIGTHNILIDGNSLACAHLGGNAIEEGIIDSGLTTSDYLNVAQSGRTTHGLIGLAATNVDSFYDSSFDKNICIIWEITNDLFLGGKSDVQAFQDLKDYCNERRHAGWMVIAATCLPRTGENADIETNRLSVNSMIRSDSSFYDSLADVASDSIMGNINSTYDIDYYYDQTHPTVEGHHLLKEYFKSALQEII